MKGLLKLKFKSLKKDLTPAGVMFYPEFSRTEKEEEYLKHEKKCQKAITEAFRATTPTLPRIPLAHKVCPMSLMPMARANAILYKMHKLAFQQCQDFRG